MLNSTQAAEFIIESDYSKRTQAGIDLSVYKIEKVGPVTNNVPLILKDKTIIDKSLYVQMLTESTVQMEDGSITSGWLLAPGVYSVSFNEGIKVPADCMAKITHRSSLYRIGNIIESPWWDPGFECENMNTTLIVNTPMFIEPNARLAQIVFYRMEKKAEELYNGQWQGLSSATK